TDSNGSTGHKRRKEMRVKKLMGVIALALCTTLTLSAGAAQAKPLKIGLVLSMSGPFATFGEQILHGIHVYMQQHGDTVAGREVELIVKDDGGINPANAKQLTLELITQDNVDILAGYDLTPNACSAASLATRGKVPMVVMNAATSSVTEKSPNIVRTSMTLPQSAWAMAKWAYDNGIRTVYIM